MNRALLGVFLAVCVLGGAVRTSFAAGETTYLTDTSITINGITLTILAGSTAQAVNFGETSLTVTAGTGNSLTLRATDDRTSLNNDAGLSACGSTNAELSITTGVVVISPSATGCPLPTAPVATPTPATGGGAITVSVSPTALANGVNPIPLSFGINNGVPTTTNPTIALNLNGDSRTVRGYVVALEPTFRQASIVNYPTSTTATFTLPNQAGTYTVYFKYYSITGSFSDLFSRQITYLANTPMITAAPQASRMPRPSLSAKPLFTRVLKLGSRGADVKALQLFLNTHGFQVSEKGVGSPGHEGLVYGSLTAKAVSKFQEANTGLLLAPFQLKKGTGIFGTATKSLVNELTDQGR